MQSYSKVNGLIIAILIIIIFIQLYMISKSDTILMWTVFGSLSQAAAALGTFWAVTTTLSLAAKENEPKIKVMLSTKINQIEVTIINLGKYPITLLANGYLQYKDQKIEIDYYQISIEEYDGFLKPNQYLTITYLNEYINTMFKDNNIPQNIPVSISFYDKELNKYHSSQKLILKKGENEICIHQS